MPCADSSFLAPLKRSPEFRSLRPRLAGTAPHPVADSWLDYGFHFFVFQLKGDEAAVMPKGVGLAVFAMHPEQVGPVSAVTVEPTAKGGQARITDLKNPSSSYVAPLPPSSSGDRAG